MSTNTPVADTSVHPLDLSVHYPPLPPEHSAPLRGTPNTLFRHSGWQATRCRIYAAMQDACVSGNRLQRFMTCGEHVHLAVNPRDTTHVKLCGSYCHDRFCVPCAKARSFHLAATLIDLLGDTKARFITLTLRSTDQPLRAQLHRLYHSFRLLRRSKLWRKTTKGSVAFTEVTYNSNLHMWHPHIHIIQTGLYIAKTVLSRTWESITGDSNIVQINAIRRKADIAKYVTKYVTKPLHFLAELDPAALCEAIQAFRGTRLCTTTGCFRGAPLNRVPPDDAYVFLCTLDDLRKRAVTGDPLAQNLLTLLRSHRICPIHPTLYEALVRDGPTTDSKFKSATSPTAPCVDAVLDPDWLWRRPP